MLFAAFLVFLLLPTAPPWYASQAGLLPGVHDLVNGALPSAVSPYYRWLNPNAVAAWPSLHSAYPALGALALWGISRRTAFITVPWCLAMWFSVIFLGEHYAIDVLGGIAFAVATWALMLYAVAPRIAAFRTQPATTTPQTAPPQTAPPQTAPPQTAPPQTAPPQTAPPRVPGDGILTPRRAAGGPGRRRVGRALARGLQ